MGLTIITPPNVTPLSIVGLDALKRHLQLATDISDEDNLIEAYLNAAWQLAEKHTWRQFLTAQYRYTLQDFRAQQPDLMHGRRLCRIMIPRPTCQSIDEVRYIDTEGEEQTLTVDEDYIVDDESEIWSIVPAYGKYWPNVRRNHPKAVQITFTAGYGETLASMPDVMLHAVRLQVGSWWLNRESIDSRQHYELPGAAKALLESIEIRDDRLITNEV